MRISDWSSDVCSSDLIPTLPQAALIYRLSGDVNPLHADPAVARQAGFPGPLLHGRCTFGVAAWALLKSCCGYQPQRLRRMQARFSSPVFPGEVVRTDIWRDGPTVRVSATVQPRGATVLTRGGTRLAGPAGQKRDAEGKGV